jgi:hypothetical protein
MSRFSQSLNETQIGAKALLSAAISALSDAMVTEGILVVSKNSWAKIMNVLLAQGRLFTESFCAQQTAR